MEPPCRDVSPGAGLPCTRVRGHHGKHENGRNRWKRHIIRCDGCGQWRLNDSTACSACGRYPLASEADDREPDPTTDRYP